MRRVGVDATWSRYRPAAPPLTRAATAAMARYLAVRMGILSPAARIG